MRVERLGTEGSACEGVEINCNLISLSALLRHLRKLPGLSVSWSRFWVPAKGHWAEVQYKGFPLFIDCDRVYFKLFPGAGCPEGTFVDVVRHLEAYKPWWPNRLAAAVSERYRERRARTS